MNKFDSKVTTNNILGIEEVYTAVKIISESVAMLPCSLKEQMEDGDIRNAKDDPIYKLLKRAPNPYTTPYEFFQWILIDMLISGAGVAIITRDENGNPDGLWQQKRSQCTAVRDPDKGFELFFDVQLDSGAKIRLPYNDLLVIKSLNDTGVFGSSIIDKEQTVLSISKSSAQYAEDFFAQGTAPSAAIALDKETTQDEFEYCKKAAEEYYSGSGTFQKAILLPKGASFEPLSIDNSKLQMLETRKFNRQVISSMFRIPLFMYNDGTMGDVEQQGIAFVKFCLLPILKNIENRLNLQLLTDEQAETKYFKFNVDALERGNLSTRMQAYSTAVNAGIETVNEVRGKEDLPTVKDGDILRVNSAIQSLDHPQNAGGSNEYSEGNQ